MKNIREHSAGGVVYRKYKKVSRLCRGSSTKSGQGVQESTKKGEQQQMQWLISKHSGYHKWVLPKGVVEKGETSEQAALREVFEETGIQAEIVKKIDFEVKYKYFKPESTKKYKKVQVVQKDKNRTPVDKTVVFYLMKYVFGDTKDRNWEMEEAKWVEYDEAIKLLGFEGEKEVLKEARGLI